MNKIEEIFKAWRIAFNPNDAQADLATKRIQICDECEFKDTITAVGIGLITRCKVCGCALKAKIFTPVTYLDRGGSCPHGKWTEVEKEWLATKKEFSLIEDDVNSIKLVDNTTYYESYDGIQFQNIVLPKIGTNITIKCMSTWNIIIKTKYTDLPDEMILKRNDMVNFVFENDKWIWQKN